MKNVLENGVNAKGWVETRAIQAVIDLAEEGDTVFFPSAKGSDEEEYIIEGSPLIITKSLTIKGEGGKTRLTQRSEGLPIFLISPENPDAIINIQDFLLISGSDGIHFSSSHKISELSEIKNIDFQGQFSSSVKFNIPEINFSIRNIKTSSGKYSIFGQNDSSYNKFFFENSLISNTTERGVSLSSPSVFSGSVTFQNIGFLNNKDAIYLNNFSIEGRSVYFINNQNNIILSGTSAFVTSSAGSPGPSVPLPHSSSHMLGGADQINVTGLSGVLATPQTPSSHFSTHLSGGTDAIPLATTASAGLMSSFDKAKSEATSPYVLLLKPSGNLGAGTFGDWESLYEFYKTLGDAPCKILFDATLVNNMITIPSGTYEINRATSLEAASYAGGATGLMFSGATFSRFNSVLALAIYNTGSYPILTISGSEFGEVCSFGGNSFIQALGSAPVIKIKTSTVIAGNSTFTIESGSYQAVELEYPGAGSPVGCVLASGQGFGLRPNSVRTANANELAYFIVITLTEGTANISLDQPDYSSVAGSLNAVATSYSKARLWYNGEVSSNFDSSYFTLEGGLVTIDSSGGSLSGSLPGKSSHLLKGTIATFKKISNDSNEVTIFPISGSGDTIDSKTSGSMSNPYSLRSYLNLGDGRWILLSSID